MSRAKMSSQRKARKIKTLLRRDGNCCWLCGEPFAEGVGRKHNRAPSLDHVVPMSQGGVHANTNLRLAHRWCNSARADRMPSAA